MRHEHEGQPGHAGDHRGDHGPRPCHHGPHHHGRHHAGAEHGGRQFYGGQQGGPHHGGSHHGGPHRHGGRRGGRPFDYGDLRLLVLALVRDEPRHGYELMKAIEERMSGSYSPSPGVIYPTLAWLEDMGYATAAAEAGGRKRYSVTDEGIAFLTANRTTLDGLLGRLSAPGEGPPPGVPDPVLRGMENLKTALRLRLRRGPADAATIEAIAAALDAAASAVEKS